MSVPTARKHSHLQQCFPNLSVTPGLNRDKHWFQADDRTDIRRTTIVIGLFRNVYDWALAMKRRPHHSPQHLRLHWSEFLTKPWTMPRPPRDLIYANVTGPICQEGYQYRQIVPCLRAKRKKLEIKVSNDHNFSGWDPQYEHRYNGTPYDSILDLRADKIRNIVLDVPSWDWVAKFYNLQYETLLKRGTSELLKSLKQATGHTPECQAFAPAPERLSNYNHRDEYIKTINNMVDWEAENLIGYHKEK